LGTSVRYAQKEGKVLGISVRYFQFPDLRPDTERNTYYEIRFMFSVSQLRIYQLSSIFSI